MDVWVLLEIDYDVTDIVGIFDSEEKAILAKQSKEKVSPFVSFIIEKREVE